MQDRGRALARVKRVDECHLFGKVHYVCDINFVLDAMLKDNSMMRGKIPVRIFPLEKLRSL